MLVTCLYCIHGYVSGGDVLQSEHSGKVTDDVGIVRGNNW